MRARAALLAVVLALRAGPALADSLPRSMRLEYTRGPGAERCPDEQSFRDVTESRMSYPPFLPEAFARLVVTLTRKGQQFQGRVELRDGDETLLWERDLGPLPSCADLLVGLGVSTAIHLDLVPAPTPAPAEQTEPKARPMESEAPAKPPSELKSPSPVKWSPPIAPLAARQLFAGGGLAVGLFVAPRPAFGLTLDAGIRWPKLSLALEGRVYLPAQSVGAEPDSALVTTSRLNGAIVFCSYLTTWFGCGLGEAGVLWAKVNTNPPFTGSRLYAAGGGRLGKEFPLFRPLTARLSGDVLMMPPNPKSVGVGDAAWVMPPVSAAFDVSIFWIF